MKRLFVILFCLSGLLVAQAQTEGVSINTTGAAPDPSAMLDISSEDQGLLTPRMTSAERTAISNPADGLLVYDTNTDSFWYYDDGQWEEIRDGSTKITAPDLLDSIPEPDFSCLALMGSLGIGSSPTSVAVSGNYAYVVDFATHDLKVIDVSDPANPSLSGSLNVGNFPASVAVSGNYAYVVDAGAGDLKVIDVSDPTNPSLSGSLGIGFNPNWVTISGNYAYVVDNGSNDLRVIDVSDPSNPIQSGILGIGNSPRSVAVSGNYAYVVDLDTDDLKVIDVSDPTIPSLSSSLSIGSDPFSVVVSGNYAYVLDLDTYDLMVIDVSDPVTPSQKGSLGIGSDPTSVAISGNYVYVLDFDVNELKVIDVSDPANPSLIGSLGVGTGPVSVAVSGNYAYVVHRNSNDLRVIKLSCPASIGINPLSGEVELTEREDTGWQRSGNDLHNTNSGNVEVQGRLILRDSYWNDQFGGSLKLVNAGNVGAGISLQSDNPDGKTYSLLSTGTNATPGAGHFGIYDHTSQEFRMVIRDNGNVGIGTNDPDTSLHIVGQIKYQDDNQMAGHVLTSDADGVGSWQAPVLDNLGNHTASQNLQLGSYYLSGDGDDEGILVDSVGNVEINKRLILRGTYWSNQFGGDLKLINSGNVGAGLTLESDNPGGKSYSLLSTGTNASPGAGHFGIFDNTAQLYRMTIRDNGRIGIGTTNPTRGKVEIVGSVDHQLGTYGFLNPDGSANVFTPSSPSPYSLYASHRIAASHFNAHSDMRIKDIQGISDGEADLSTLMDIEITDYTMRDTVSHGTVLNKKVIAQQAAEVYPQAVTTNLTEVIPDIYQRAELQDGWIMLATDLQVGERVKLITEEGAKVYEVSKVENNRFQVADLLLPLPASRSAAIPPLFVYGREVDDFHTVDYEALSMLNVSATQEQQRIIEDQQAEIEALKAENAAMQISFEARLRALEALLSSPSSKAEASPN